MLSIFPEINPVFDFNPSVNVRGVFLYIPKAFGKVQYPGLYKLATHQVRGTFINLLSNFFALWLNHKNWCRPLLFIT